MLGRLEDLARVGSRTNMGSELPSRGLTTGRGRCPAKRRASSADEAKPTLAPGVSVGREVEPADGCNVDENSFLRAENEDDDGYDPFSDRPAPSEPLFERDPWR